MITAYPLTWPQGFPRSKVKENGQFKTTLAGSLKNVNDSLRKFASDSGKKLENLIISSNVTLGAERPADPAVAVWFNWDGMGVCIAVDRYNKVESNLQAIHHILEARRTELRHGTLALVRATFQGFKALPAPDGKSWKEVLGYEPGWNLEQVKARYRTLSSEHHPDKGGNAEKMAEINLAWSSAQVDMGETP